VELFLTDEQEFLSETVDKFLAAECPPTTVRALADTDDGFDRDLWQRGAALGWTSMLVPEEYGGGTVSGAGLVDLALVAELFGRHVAPGPLVPTNLVALAVARAGTDAQKRSLLPRIAGGGVIGAWCDGATRSGATAPMRVAHDGDDYILEGDVSPVEAAAEADVLVVAAMDGGLVRQFVVPVDSTGLTFDPLEGLDVVRRFATVSFDGCRVSGHHELTNASVDDVSLCRSVRHAAIALHVSESTGAAARVFDFTLEWAFDRYTFGRPLASYQEIKHRFADMRMWLEACAATSAAAVRAVDEGRGDAGELTSVAKAYVGEHTCELVQDCVQIHGGIGVTWEHDLHLFLRRVTTNWALFGVPSDHREQLAAWLASAQS
jgi:alkylation response protein AidB-like acyl-CoA dehydrogenase